MDMAIGFVIGLALGGVLGLLLGPALSAWIGRLEWRTASREIELTDRLLESLESTNEAQTGRPDGGPREQVSLHEHAH